MKKLTFIIAAIAICFGITINAFAQKPKPSPTPSPSPTPTASNYVTAEFMTYADAANTILNKVRMDTPGIPYSHGVAGVTAEFFAGGSRDLVIRLNYNNCSRTTTYEFSEIADSRNVPAWIMNNPVQSFKPFINVLGAYYAKETCAPVNGVYNCNYKTRMNNGYLSASGDSATYALLFNPQTTNDRPVNLPEYTSFVNVNYQRDQFGKDVYTITPLPNEGTPVSGIPATGRIIAGLEKNSGRTVTSAGQYVMPFTLVVRPK